MAKRGRGPVPSPRLKVRDPELQEIKGMLTDVGRVREQLRDRAEGYSGWLTRWARADSEASGPYAA